MKVNNYVALTSRLRDEIETFIDILAA